MSDVLEVMPNEGLSPEEISQTKRFAIRVLMFNALILVLVIASLSLWVQSAKPLNPDLNPMTTPQQPAELEAAKLQSITGSLNA